MNDRLNLEIVDEYNTILVNVYHHHGGTTAASLEIAKSFYDNFSDETMKGLHPMVRIVKALQKSGSKLTPDEIVYARKNFRSSIAKAIADGNGFKPDREKGLISVSPYAVLETNVFTNRKLKIYIEEEKIVCFSLETIELLTLQEMNDVLDLHGRTLEISHNPFGNYSSDPIFVSVDEFMKIYEVVRSPERSWTYFSTCQYGENDLFYYKLIE